MVHSLSPRTYFAFPSFSLFFSLLRSQCIFSFSLVISFRWLRGVQFLFFSASLFVDTIRRLLLSRSSFTVHIVVSLSPFGSCVLFFYFVLSHCLCVCVYVYLFLCLSLSFDRLSVRRDREPPTCCEIYTLTVHRNNDHSLRILARPICVIVRDFFHPTTGIYFAK